MKKRISQKCQRMCKALLSGLLSVVMVAGVLSGNMTIRAQAEDLKLPDGDTIITLDGDTNDWDFIDKFLRDDGGFASVAAFTTKNNLYILRDLSSVEGYGVDQIMIDANGNHKDGLNFQGSDYMLQGTSLYTYNGLGGAWGWGATTPYEVKMSADKTVAEYKIPLSSIGNPTGTVRVNIGAVKSDWSTLASYPASSSSFVDVPAFEKAYIESDSVVISDFIFKASDNLNAITENTMAGGTVGTFSAKGGNGTYSYMFAPSNIYGKDNDRFDIVGDKLVVKEGLLAPGNYTIFVKVASDIRSEKKAFSFIVEAAGAATAIDESIFSGKNGQWFAVNHNAANAIPNLSELKAVSDGHFLYAYVSAVSLSNMADFYIETANRGGNDLTDSWEDASDVDYKVNVDGTVYAGINGNWTETGAKAECYKTSTGAEIKVALSDLGNATGKIYVGIKDGESSLLPNKGKKMLECSTPSLAKAPEITLDGNPDDWAGISPIASGSGTIGNLYAFRDADNLCVMTYVKNPDFGTSAALSTNLLVNADGNAATGYQHANFKQGSGADILVQDWFSNDCEGDVKNIEFFYTKLDTWKWTAISGNNGYKVCAPVSDTEYCIEYVLPVADIVNSLGAASDDFYIAVDRENLQGQTPAGSAPVNGSFVKVPKYNTTVSVVVGDQSFADWTSVSNSVSNTAVESSTNLYATCSEERLYTIVTSENGGLNTVNIYYISTDDNTGYEYSGFDHIDYIVKDALLFKVVADNEISETADDVWMSYYNDSVEMQLYLSQIGNPSTIKIAWRGIDGNALIPTEGLLNVNAKFILSREAGFYYPTEDFASFDNPYKGWIRWATRYESDEAEEFAFDSNTVYLAVRWSEFEPEKGFYDYKGIEEKYNLPYWKEKGVRINVRFVMDNPEELGRDENTRMDIPKWLYDELVSEVKKGNIDSAGTFYNDMENLCGAGFSPNYDSELLIYYHDKAIKALAEYFDDNAITSFIQIGSLGHWGEIHTWPEGTGEFPIPSIATRYMESYTKYFKNVKVGLRKPYPYAADNDFGLFNDIFGSTQYAGIADYWGYITNGDIDMPGATSEEISASKMPNFWKKNYSGGEFAQGNVKLHVTNDGIIKCLDDVRTTHVSWLGPCSPADLETKEFASYVYEANILALQKLMGYNYALEKITRLESVKLGEDTVINMVWNNEGVAPFYYEWPLEISLIDEKGKVAYKEDINVNLTEWMPGRTNVNAVINVPKNVETGTYTLAVAIDDKDSLEPAVKLAIEGAREDLRYPLYQLKLEKAGKDDKKDSSDNGNDGERKESKVAETFNNVITAFRNIGNSIAEGLGIGDSANEEEINETETAETIEPVTEELGESDIPLSGTDDLGITDDGTAEAVVNPVVVAEKGFRYWWIVLTVLVVLAGGAFAYFKVVKKEGENNE